MRSVGGAVSGRGLDRRNPFLAAPELRGWRTVGGTVLSAKKKAEPDEEELDRQLQKDPAYQKLVSHPSFCFRSRAAQPFANLMFSSPAGLVAYRPRTPLNLVRMHQVEGAAKRDAFAEDFVDDGLDWPEAEYAPLHPPA